MAEAAIPIARMSCILGRSCACIGPLSRHRSRRAMDRPRNDLWPESCSKAAVDAVITMAPDRPTAGGPCGHHHRSGEMAKARGMRMGYAPLLALLEPARAAGYKRLAVIGVPCQVHALRKLEDELGLEALYVIGTPCSDNTSTENFHGFLDLWMSSQKPLPISSSGRFSVSNCVSRMAGHVSFPSFNCRSRSFLRIFFR